MRQPVASNQRRWREVPCGGGSRGQVGTGSVSGVLAAHGRQRTGAREQGPTRCGADVGRVD